MKRFWCLLFCAGLVLCIEGCRRSSSEKKSPILVSQEKDFIYGRSSNDLIAKIKVIPKDVPTLDGKAAEALQIIAKAKRQADTELLGKEFVAFRLEMKPTDQDNERFRSFLRRRDQLELYEAVTGKKMEVVFFSFSSFPQHVLARHLTTSEDQYPVFQPGAPRSLLATADYDDRIRHQELYVAWKYTVDYSLPHYTSIPPDTIQKLLGTNTPARALALIKQTQPQSIKNPPEARSFEKFKRYLKDNVSPEVAQALEEKRLRVNLDANFYDDGDWLVCQGAKTEKKIASGGVAKVQLTMHCDGLTVGVYDASLIATKFK